MKIRNLIQKEFKIANQPAPKDRADYKAKMSTIQDLQRNPKLRDPETQANIMKRKAELKTWAKKNLKNENSIEEGHYPHVKSFDKLYGIVDIQQYKHMADDAQSMDMEEFMDTYNSVIDMAGDFWQDHQKTDEDADIDAQMKSDVLQFLNSKVVQIEKQIELAPANTPEEKENKEFALKLFNFVQAKLEQKDNGDNTITVPKSFKKD
tara:strand:+ start:561 stop:1181 length:621 start_codon:yes stop_codon:yes gene_type:complete